MRNIIEILATASVMIIVGMLLRHSLRRLTAVVFVMGALAVSLAMPSTASAGEFRHGEPSYTLPAGETMKTDLFVAGQTIRIDGDVDGDLYSWGQSLTVNGHVTGDVLSWGQDVRINGRVDGNVRNWSQTLTITGTVGKNITAFVQRLEVDLKGTVGGSITATGQEIELDGPVGRDVMGSFASMEFNSGIGGNVRARSHDISIGSGADLKGEVVYRGDRAPSIDPGAKVVGPVHADYEEHVSKYRKTTTYWHWAFGWAAAFVFGLALILIVPGFFGDVVRASDRTWQSCGIGLLVLPGVVVAALIACATVVGLAVGISTLLIYAIALYSAQVFVGAWIGEKILGEGLRTGAMLGRLALGLLILRALHLIPWVGGIVLLIVLVWGLGAISLTLYKRIRPNLAAAA